MSIGKTSIFKDLIQFMNHINLEIIPFNELYFLFIQVNTSVYQNIVHYVHISVVLIYSTNVTRKGHVYL